MSTRKKSFRIAVVNNQGLGTIEVKGESVVIPGFEFMETFIHRNINNYLIFVVSDAVTGRSIGSGRNKKQAAIDDARDQLLEHVWTTPDAIDKHHRKIVRKVGKLEDMPMLPAIVQFTKESFR